MSSPFSEFQYKELLEGLEITIKLFSELNFNNPTHRLDSEFFKKEYLTLYESLFKKPCDKLESLSEWVTQGPNPSFSESTIPCLTGRNINKGRVNYNNADYVSEQEYQSLKRFQLKYGDTLITLKGKGSIGKVGYVTDERKAIFSRDIGVIRLINIDPAYVNAFVLSKYGKKIIERGETGGTGQSTLTASYLKNIDVPRIPIESEIGELITHSESIFSLSNQKYLSAENLLLTELGLNDFEPSKEAVNVKSFSESFGASGRFDAEYYQLKYEQIVRRIKEHPYESLSNLVQIKKSIEPGSKFYSQDETGLPFLRVSDYSKFGITDPNKKLTLEFVNENKTKIDGLKPKKGTILFSKDGSVGTAYHLRQNYNGITSGAILHLKVIDSTKVLPEYLTLVLNSKLVQMQAERDAGGSIILHWRIGEIEQVVIPVIDFAKQEQIADLIEESFQLKKQSEQLLEIAKRSVEIAIEKDESAAMKYINRQTENLGSVL